MFRVQVGFRTFRVWSLGLGLASRSEVYGHRLRVVSSGTLNHSYHGCCSSRIFSKASSINGAMVACKGHIPYVSHCTFPKLTWNLL